MRQKKIMILGGNHVQLTAIQAAKEQEYYVITVDYLPNNPGHKLADEYYNISTVDKDSVLQLAQKLQIDGIVSYASDVSSPTAAYVAETMGLPTNPYESVRILTHKNLFRGFMRKYGLPMPKGASFKHKNDAINFFNTLNGAAMMKPIDSSGSKGVFKCNTTTDLLNNWDESLYYSISKEIIVEEFIEKKGCQIDGDIFMDSGNVVFWGLCDQHQDTSLAPYVPVGLSFPSTQRSDIMDKLKIQLLRILSILNMKMGAYNIEYIVGADEQVYILEIGPRNGGNWIPNVIKRSTGFDMAANTVRQSVGDTLLIQSQIMSTRPVCSFLIHSSKCGILDRIDYSNYIMKHVVDAVMFTETGSPVDVYENSSNALGILLLEFNSIFELEKTIDNIDDHVKVVLR